MTDPAPFFEPGHTYIREHHGRTIEFHVRYVDTAPDCDFPTAFGWRKDPEMPAMLPMDSDDIGGWTDITPDPCFASAGQALATDEAVPSRRAGLRDEIAEALEAADYRMDMRRGDLADSVMPVLYRAWPWLRAEAEEATVLPATVDRAAVLREAADSAYRIARRLDDQQHDERAQGAWDVENALRAELRRMAGETPTAAASAVVVRRATDETPGEPTDADVVEAHRLALSFALGLGTGAPWDAIRDRAADLGEAEQPAVGAQQPKEET